MQELGLLKIEIPSLFPGGLILSPDPYDKLQKPSKHALDKNYGLLPRLMRVSMASFALSVRMFTTKGGVQSIKYTYSVSHYYTRFIEIIENFQKQVHRFLVLCNFCLQILGIYVNNVYSLTRLAGWLLWSLDGMKQVLK